MASPEVDELRSRVHRGERRLDDHDRRITMLDESQRAIADTVIEVKEALDALTVEVTEGFNTLTARVNALSGTVDGHTATLAEHGATLAGHTTTLDQHTTTLAEHGEMLREILTLVRQR